MISKIIADRLKRVIRDLFGEWQTRFIHRRHASNNIVITQEVVHSLRSRKGKKGAMVVKIDLEKAHDRVDWGFPKSGL